ncbi:hypothetical protein TWF730_004580 [Orbilia blumenaviensis]|uniref:Uncharacterized protein n=1 Tax=Orbilia blumenaviensis TaxID=1796055 RepID=A0AAV9TYG9_9PEZI
MPANRYYMRLHTRRRTSSRTVLLSHRQRKEKRKRRRRMQQPMRQDRIMAPPILGPRTEAQNPDLQCPNLPSLLHTLSHLEPLPQSFPDRRSSCWDIIKDGRRVGVLGERKDEMRVLLALGHILATTSPQSFSPDDDIEEEEGEVAVMLQLRPKEFRVFYTVRGGSSEKQRSYVMLLEELVKHIVEKAIKGNYNHKTRRIDDAIVGDLGRLFTVVVVACRTRILDFLKGLAREKWSCGLEGEREDISEEVKEKEVVDWDALIEFVKTGGLEAADSDDIAAAAVAAAASPDGKDNDERIKEKIRQRSRSRSQSRRRRVAAENKNKNGPTIKTEEHEEEEEVPKESRVERIERKKNFILERMDQMRQNLARLRLMRLADEPPPPSSQIDADIPPVPPLPDGLKQQQQAKKRMTLGGVKRGIVSLLIAGKTENMDTETMPNWLLMQYVRVASLIVRFREKFEPLITFTDGQMVWITMLGRYLEASKIIIRKVYMQKYWKLLANLTIFEVRAPVLSLCEPRPTPSQNTIRRVLEWVEQEHFEDPSIMNSVNINAIYPHSYPDVPWIHRYPREPNAHYCHPEAVIAHYVMHTRKILKTRFLAIGSNGKCCWACDVYVKSVHRVLLNETQEEGGGGGWYCGESVYKVGCNGRVPEFANDEYNYDSSTNLWDIPLSNRMDQRVRDEMVARLEGCVGRIVDRVRREVLSH